MIKKMTKSDLVTSTKKLPKLVKDRKSKKTVKCECEKLKIPKIVSHK